jgi:hypothetical protein
MSGFEANIVGERWVLIATKDGVVRFDLDLLPRQIPAIIAHQQVSNLPPIIARGEIRNLQPTALAPDWRWHEVEQYTRAAGASK